MLLTVAEDKCDSGELDLTGIDDEELDKVRRSFNFTANC